MLIVLMTVAVLVLCTLAILSLRRVVPANEVHVVRTSTKTCAYGHAPVNNQELTGNQGSVGNQGNTYYRFPEWVPYLGTQVTKLSSAILELELPSYDAYDKDKTPFVVEVKAFYRISDFILAASRIGSTEKLVEQLLDITRGAVRSILAKEDIEYIMCERNKYGQLFTNEVSDQLREWGVEAVKNIELMDVRDTQDSKVVDNIMAKKKSQIDMESRTAVALNMKKANEAEIEAEKDIKLKQQLARQEIGLRQAQVEKEIGIAQETAKQEVQSQAKLTAEKEMEVKQVNTVKAAEIEKEAAVIKATSEKNVVEVSAEAQVTKANADKKVQILKAEAVKQETELKADADLKVATNRAQGTQANGIAEAEALRLKKDAEVSGDITLSKVIGENKDYQEFVLRQKQIEVLGEVGKEQARNLSNADIKIFANANDVTKGLNKASSVFSSGTGLDLNSLLEALGSSEKGQELFNSVVNRISGNNDKQ